MADVIPIRRALVSVSDKDGLIPLARALVAAGCELISTGGTARALTEAGLAVTPVDEVTRFPEMLDGRVKTLHPGVHAGLLARRDDPAHLSAIRDHGIAPIDLVIVSLYPFERTTANPDVTLAEAIENIDIGGPSMIRSAAKNHASVGVVTDPAQYATVIAELELHAGLTLATRQALAAAAFARTAAYDAAIAAFLTPRFAPEDALLPDRLILPLERTTTLRYGENPHQRAAVYRATAGALAGSPSVIDAVQLHGKELSYNNLLDAAAAVATMTDLARLAPEHASAAVVKHTNPCGAAHAPAVADAIDLALAGDPVAAFGGILACSRAIDRAAAERLSAKGLFLEVVIAPTFDADALEMLRARWANVRLLALGDLAATPPALTVRTIPGGALAQEPDALAMDHPDWTIGAGPPIADAHRAVAAAVWAMAKNLTSNAIAIGGIDGAGVRLFGAGAGQMDRIASCRIAIEKAGDRARGAIAASDAFFPFADGPAALIDAGVSVIVHPGGSKRDRDTLDLCDQRGITCLVTGARHFRH